MLLEPLWNGLDHICWIGPLVNGSYSEKFPLPRGVPQGSCLVRCYLQIMKVSYLKFFKGHLPEAHAYVDDTQLYFSFQPDSTMSEVDVVNALHTCIKDIRTWMIVDKLKLNDEKTELIVIGSRVQQARLM